MALKVYAGGLTDLADIAQLLAHNPQADLDTVRAVAGPYDEGRHLEAVIAEAARIRAGGEQHALAVLSCSPSNANRPVIA